MYGEKIMKNFNINKNSNQSGRSMIEMLGVLAIVGVLSVGGIAGYSKAMTKFKINKTIDQVTHIATNLRTLYAQQKECEGLYHYNNDTILKLGILPSEMETTTSISGLGGMTTIALGGTPFNGGATVTCQTNSNDKGFVINYFGLPKEACLELVTKDWGTPSSTGLYAISADVSYNMSGPAHAYNITNKTCDYRQSVAVACVNDTTYPLPMKMADAIRGCDCEGDTCSVGWLFK